MRNIVRWIGFGVVAVAAPAMLLVPAAGAASGVDPTGPVATTSAAPSLPLCIRHLSVGDRRFWEGTRTSLADSPYTYVTFPVTSTGCARAGEVTYTLVAGSATAGLDYLTATGRLTFRGTSMATVTVPATVLKDPSPGDDETFAVHLSAPTAGLVLTDPYGSGTILNDDVSCVPPPDYVPPAPPMMPDYHCSE